MRTAGRPAKQGARPHARGEARRARLAYVCAARAQTSDTALQSVYVANQCVATCAPKEPTPVTSVDRIRPFQTMVRANLTGLDATTAYGTVPPGTVFVVEQISGRARAPFGVSYNISLASRVDATSSEVRSYVPHVGSTAFADGSAFTTFLSLTKTYVAGDFSLSVTRIRTAGTPLEPGLAGVDITFSGYLLPASP